MALGGSTDVVVRFLGDVSKLRDDVSSIEGGFGKLKKMALGVGAAVGAAFAGREVVQFGKASVDAALESEKATKRLDQVFKSMGDSTGKASQEAQKFAGTLMKKIGVDDEAIMASQALLATFKNVGSEAGRNAGIFNRATVAAQDLAATGYGNAEQASKMLGKALNDPIKGLAALGRAGVQFTAEQKEAIKTAMQHGDVLKAQQIIMGEVEHQVGGVAAATATGTDKMKVAFGEFQEGVGKAILPIVNAILPLLTQAFEWAEPIITSAIKKVQEVIGGMVAWVVANWPQIRDTAITVFNAVRDAIMPIVERIAQFVQQTLIPAFAKVWDAILKAAPDILAFFQQVGEIAQAVFPKIVTVLDKVTPVLAAIIVKLIQFVALLARNKDIVLALAAPVLAYVAAMKTWAAVQKGVQLATKAWTAAQALLNAVMTANPIGLIIAGVVLLIAIFVLLYTKVDWFRAAIDTLWQFMQTAWDAILGIVRGVYNWIVANWPLLLAILTGPIGAAVLIVVKNWDTIKGAVEAAFNWIKTNWPTLLAILTGPIGVAVLLITKNWDTIQEAIQGVWNWIKSTWSQLQEILTAPFRAAASAIRSAIDGIRNAMSDAWNFISGLVRTITDAITGIPGKVADIGGRIASALKGPINSVIRAWNRLEFKVPEVNAGPIHFGGQTIGMPNIPELAKGGYVTATGYAKVHEGEWYSGVGNMPGNTTYNINLSVAPGTDPAQTGRTVVDLIRAYERANGKRVLAVQGNT